MANPFTSGSYRQTKGQADSPERPDMVKPVPEQVQGPAFPYRGSNTHGVDPTKGVNLSEYYENNEFDDEEDTGQPLPPQDETDPVPVRIVQHSARELAQFRTVRFSVTGPQQILGRHEKRSAVYIKVHKVLADGSTVNTDPIYVGSDSGISTYTGYRLDVGDNFPPINTTEDIWVTCDPTKVIEVSVIYEFGVEL
jgi:hypothetical protein